MHRPRLTSFATALFLFAPFILNAGPPPPPAPTPASTASPAPAAKSESSGWVFSILPKSLQKNPTIDLTVITEMTELGKKLPPVTPAKPAYYLTKSGGFQQRG